ncbi:MAG: hypothetical protein IT172_09345 [Acidobacteria bacterium]|nr:hypothetical protein [Acidobacteriota bacterium]
MAGPKQKGKKDSAQAVFTRFMLIVGFFAIWFLGVAVRLVHLQVDQHEWLSARAESQRQDHKRSKLLRGTIYDRDGRPLAMSVRAQTLYADPREINDVAATAKAISKVIKFDAQRFIQQVNEAKEKNRRYVVVARKLDDATVEKVNGSLVNAALKKGDLPRFEGLHWTDDQVRNYPYGPMAAQVVGFNNLDDAGVGGVEQSQDKILQGPVIRTIQERDRLGRVYDEMVEERGRPGDVTLTIGVTLQNKVEQALEQGVRNADAKSGMAIAISPKTGEVLAMANYPSFDPNALGEALPPNAMNHIIQSVYSPGSVMKLVTYGSALEKKLITPNDMVDAGNGSIEVAGHRFTDSHHVGKVTYAEALAHSSNVCAIKTGLRVGKEDFFAMLSNMGFGARTGIELPGETGGIVRPPERWNGDSLASMSIGYEIGVNALQMATAFATIANDGVKIRPHIIKEVHKPDEAPVRTDAESVRIVSPETARDLRTMLRQVVLTGTGKRAQLNGYTSAGKTGTAWKFNSVSKSVDQSKYISSFIGMAPAEDPQVVIAVVIDEPKSGARDGGGVAAPIFKTIAEQILPELGIQPDPSAVKPTAAPAQIEPEAPATPPSVRTTTADKMSGKKPAAKPGSRTDIGDAVKQTAPSAPKAEAKSKPATGGKQARTNRVEAVPEKRRSSGRAGVT